LVRRYPDVDEIGFCAGALSPLRDKAATEAARATTSPNFACKDLTSRPELACERTTGVGIARKRIPPLL
jgi:hypothetical protein